jgi:hypothetical protein
MHPIDKEGTSVPFISVGIQLGLWENIVISNASTSFDGNQQQ